MGLDPPDRQTLSEWRTTCFTPGLYGGFMSPIHTLIEDCPLNEYDLFLRRLRQMLH